MSDLYFPVGFVKMIASKEIRKPFIHEPHAGDLAKGAGETVAIKQERVYGW